ncbi:MAG: NAD(P)H-hydrate epimerase [Gammaproteobacteria bacterium]|nr:NAD(P)H-hydrate epimerase [Gammaproteobacteria bacterium]
MTCPWVAVDIPSGLHADSGRILGIAVEASLTMSFIGLKAGLFTGDGRACAGRLPLRRSRRSRRPSIEWPVVRRRLRIRTLGVLSAAGCRRAAPTAAREGHFGHVLIVGGDRGFAGAARMAGESRTRWAAAWLSVATPPGTCRRDRPAAARTDGPWCP